MIIPEGEFQYIFDYDDWFAMNELNKRHLIYNGEIEDDVIDIVSSHILRFNAEDKGKPVEDRQPIVLYINSPGGEVASGFGACSAILTSTTPIYTVNLGKALSMAFMLYICGQKRFTMPYSQFLMHDGATFIGYESSAKVRDRVSFDQQVEDKIKELVLQRTNMTADFYDDKYRKEFYFLPEEAKNLGVTDYIIGQDCSIDEIV